MKLTTDKALIVFYDEFNELYRFCGRVHFKSRNYGELGFPVLYTSSFWVARNTTEELNKGLRA